MNLARQLRHTLTIRPALRLDGPSQLPRPARLTRRRMTARGSCSTRWRRHEARDRTPARDHRSHCRPAPETVDHLCRNRACVNPDHMEPVTNQEKCPRGHDYSQSNTYYNPLGRKVCRTCATAARARYENRTTA